MVKLMSLTLLDGLLRSQCVQGTFCLDKKYKNKLLSKNNVSHDTRGATFTLVGKVRGWCNSPYILDCLGGFMVDSSHLFIKGESVLDSLEFSLGQALLFQNFYPKYSRVFTLYEQLECFRNLKNVPKRYVIKVQKYMTAEAPNMYLQQMDHNTIPTSFEKYMPNVYGFTGRIKRFLENRMYRKTGKNREFWNSYLQGIKRCCHEAENDVLYDEYMKHRDILTQKPSGELDSRIRTYVLRATERVKVSKVKLYEASTSASFTTPRSKGGQRADVRDWLISKYGVKTVDKFVDNGITYHLEGPNIPDVTKLAKDICNSFLYKDGIRRPLNVKVHGILEPLKVRKITKGEAVPYWFCRSLQKDLHGSLQQYPQFAPTGRPIERYDIHALVDRERKVEEICPLGFNGWVSGDYSAATDGVDIRVTMSILEEILKNSCYNDDMKEIARSVLGPQMLHYPRIKDKDPISPALQMTGQLMGSVLSFPVLCYINVITYWMSIEEYTGHVFKLEELPCIVNGDDILFRANDEFYELWKTNIKKVGFTMSIGKNYFHPDTFLINSQMYHINGNIISGKYTLDKIPFYNLGLLTGKAKTTGRNNTKIIPLWSWYSEVVGKANDKWDAHKRFLYYHKNVIENITGDGVRNMFIPRWLGGCGFPLYDEVKQHVKVTTSQAVIASYVQQRVKDSCLKGEHPGQYTLRLIQDDLLNESKPYQYYKVPDRAYTVVDLGCKDRYKLVPRLQPLNYNETLELQRQHNLPLLANIPDNFDKRDLIVKHPKFCNLRTAMRLLCKCNLKPLPKQVLLNGGEYKLVRVREDTLGELMSRDESGDLPDIIPDFNDFIVKHDKFHTGDLTNDIKIITSDHHTHHLKKVDEKKLFGGISLVIHQEI